MLWNEPNNLSHWNRDLDPQWATFGEMIRLAGERIASVAPGLTRVLGGVSPIDPGFLQTLFDHQGVPEVLDVAAVHGFPLDWNRWHTSEWEERVRSVRRVVGSKPVWATEVGASSLVSSSLQAWAVDETLRQLLPHVERAYWYALMDLPAEWEAVTRHRGTEGSAYYRHFRMGLFDARGEPKPAAERLATWAQREPFRLGICEWVYWREEVRLRRMARCLRQLGVRRLRTGIGWADWDRPGALEWFDQVMTELAELEITLTLCFTPERLGQGTPPHHTSPPRELGWYADFCEQVVRRYAAVPVAVR